MCSQRRREALCMIYTPYMEDVAESNGIANWSLLCEWRGFRLYLLGSVSFLQFRLTIATLMLDIETKWTLNA
jgi:hypothetical protein